MYKQAIALVLLLASMGTPAIAGDVDMAIEFGNGVVLKGLNRRIAKDMKTLNVSDMESLQKVIEELS